MSEKVLNSADYQRYSRTIITVLREHCDVYEADIVLKQAFGDTVEVVILENPTTCAAETVYRAILQADLSGQLIIKDSDCLVERKYIPEKDHIVGLTIDHNVHVDRLQEKSFIIKNDDDVVVDILEKEMVSNIICLGVYCVGAADFVRAYENIRTSDVYKHENEIYVSHVISYLIICDSHIFEYVEADNYIDWGTVSEWHKEMKKHNTYIFDIDGVVLENCGKYGSKNWSNHFKPIEKNVEILKNLSDMGNEIIFMTARPEKYLATIKNYLKEKKITYKTIISDCNHSKRIIINDFAATNPYPSCAAISIKRNDSLDNYL